MSDKQPKYRFDKVDIVQLRLIAQLPPERRLIPMLNARAFMRAIMMGRLREQYPDASQNELGMKLLKELEDAERRASRPKFVR